MDARTPEKPPATRDAEATRQRILEASRAEFARHGFGGARVERIASAARTNKRMLYYYFGKKDALFLAALEAAYDDIRAAEQKLRLETLEPAEAIERLVRFTWDYFVANPAFMVLLNTENLHQAKHVKRSKRVHTMNSPLILTIRTVLERGVAKGRIRPGIDPVQLYVSIAGLCYFYLSNVHTLSVIFGRDLQAPASRRERIEHVVELVRAALRA